MSIARLVVLLAIANITMIWRKGADDVIVGADIYLAFAMVWFCLIAFGLWDLWSAWSDAVVFFRKRRERNASRSHEDKSV